MTAEYAAKILDAMGRRDAAETLRWGAPPPASRADELAAELDAVRADLADEQARMAALESLLCHRCHKKWRSADVCA